MCIVTGRNGKNSDIFTRTKKKNGPSYAQPLSSAEFWERQAAASRAKMR
eukprot:COSAG04_NODE_2749_length_3644_cov_4.300705_7_plen_48_part_01